tara:strand:- start:521 stop:1198 length:678 start_codon:yes stop_codon:yes gene_type:complete
MNTFKKLFFASLISISSFSFTEVSLSGNVAVTTDYVWRGMSQNAEDPSVSGGFDLEHSSGFYIGLWAANVLASSTDLGADNAVGGAGANADVTSTGSMELDGYLGFAGSFNDDAGYDIGYIAYTYPGVDAWDFEELYFSVDFFGAYVMYAAGIDAAADYYEVGYGIDAGPGSFSISYGDYDGMGTNYLIGYDWSVGDFTIGFAYTDFNADVAANDYDTAILTISY